MKPNKPNMPLKFLRPCHCEPGTYCGFAVAPGATASDLEVNAVVSYLLDTGATCPRVAVGGHAQYSASAKYCAVATEQLLVGVRRKRMPR